MNALEAHWKQFDRLERLWYASVSEAARARGKTKRTANRRARRLYSQWIRFARRPLP